MDVWIKGPIRMTAKTDTVELRQLLDQVDAQEGGLGMAIEAAQLEIAAVKARLGRLRELGKLLKTTTERKPRKKRTKKADSQTVLIPTFPDDPDGTRGLTGEE